jgi:hypothetical protein
LPVVFGNGPGQAQLGEAGYTQLHLARRLAPDLRRPWERPPPPGKDLSPARVRRGFRHIRDKTGTPAPCAETLPPRTRTAQGQHQRPGPVLPRRQEERGSTRRVTCRKG